MNGGVVTGGWEFVWAAYGVTAAVLIIYGISLATRLRDVRARARSEEMRSGK